MQLQYIQIIVKLKNEPFYPVYCIWIWQALTNRILSTTAQFGSMTTCADWIGSVSSIEQMPSPSKNEILMRFNTQYPTGSNLQTWYMYNGTARRVFFKNELFLKIHTNSCDSLIKLTAISPNNKTKLIVFRKYHFCRKSEKER